MKSSPIFIGVTEIRMKYYLARDKHDNTALESHEYTMSGHSSLRDERVGPGPTSP
jgi:hypothetical protein